MNGMGSSAGGVPPGTPQEAWMVDLYSLECPLLAYHGMFVCLDFGILFWILLTFMNFLAGTPVTATTKPLCW